MYVRRSSDFDRNSCLALFSALYFAEPSGVWGISGISYWLLIKDAPSHDYIFHDKLIDVTVEIRIGVSVVKHSFHNVNSTIRLTIFMSIVMGWLGSPHGADLHQCSIVHRDKQSNRKGLLPMEYVRNKSLQSLGFEHKDVVCITDENSVIRTSAFAIEPSLLVGNPKEYLSHQHRNATRMRRRRQSQSNLFGRRRRANKIG